MVGILRFCGTAVYHLGRRGTRCCLFSRRNLRRFGPVPWTKPSPRHPSLSRGTQQWRWGGCRMGLRPGREEGGTWGRQPGEGWGSLGGFWGVGCDPRAGRGGQLWL